MKIPASLLNRRFIEIILADKTYDPLYDLIALNPLQIAGNSLAIVKANCGYLSIQ